MGKAVNTVINKVKDQAEDKGIFITIEGVDGAGKTTLSECLKIWLINKKIDVVVTREPGGTRLGELLRKILLDEHDDADRDKAHLSTRISAETELMLMFAARMQHLHEVILPALIVGRYVLCDRFTDATYAYQGGGRGLSEQRIQQLENWVQKGLQPNLTIILDVPITVGLQRTRQRGSKSDRFERQHLEFKESVRQAYLRRAEKFPHRIKLIDATRGLVEVKKDLLQSVAEFLAKK